VGGEVAALIDCGPASVKTRLLDELSRNLESPHQLGYVLLTHAHFDHLGGLPFIRRYNPAVKLVANPLTSELLEQKDLVKDLFERNKASSEAMENDFDVDFDEWTKALQVDKVMGDGDLLDLGADVHIKLVIVPGHSSDTSAYYILPDCALAAGEAVGGYYGRDQVVSCYRYNYKEYLESLDKLSSLQVRMLSLPHGGALVGDIAGKYLVDAKIAAERFAAQVSERVKNGDLIDEIHRSTLLEWSSANYAPEGPFYKDQSEALHEMIKASVA
jgi:glyoxylase-like metal-dependent hydrolase (beta-lactamase superfamily II)